ncbi:dihydroorotase [Skermanella stibiiresistens SB22]|uniref:Dihydroorotase n=1 Tax=Skermanella stibiiresistens SB22 TaxID=1385369 RepID=W9HAV8_9PROT|nr:dihydroorotase [Skermanella stibiiresistens]EWY41876.1 dihydroorotase [Skermanella stibiiresistens SB22]
MTRRIAYRHARLLDPASGLDTVGTVLTEGGVIADLGAGLFADGVPDGIETIDLRGLCLAPGLIDMRVAAGDGHGYVDEDTARSAAAGGVTSIVLLPPHTSLRHSPVRVFHYAGATTGTGALAEMGLAAQVGALAFTDGANAIADAAVMVRVMRYAAALGRFVIQHPEEPSLAAGGQMNAGEVATRMGLPGIPAQAEVIPIERDLRLVELTGARLHIAHVSTGAAVDVIRDAKRRGLPVTCDTAPAYFALTETDVMGYRTVAKLSPPLRDEMERRAIVEGLADGTIDAIASDHQPHPAAAKDVPFPEAASGIVGLETLLPLTLEMVQNGKLPMLDALGLLTAGPARLLGLELGRLAKGATADLTIFDPDWLWRVDVGRFASGSRNSPFDRRPVTGRAIRTVVAGETVFTLDA